MIIQLPKGPYYILSTILRTYTTPNNKIERYFCSEFSDKKTVSPRDRFMHSGLLSEDIQRSA